MNSISSLPLFPLSLVLYPDEQLSLHIFEERYRDLTAYCLAHDVAFGVVRVDEDEWADVGTTARIDRVVKRYDDGRSDIVCGAASGSASKRSTRIKPRTTQLMCSSLKTIRRGSTLSLRSA